MKSGLRGKRLHRVQNLHISLRAVLLVGFFLLGVMLGYTYACCSVDTISGELASYLEGYLQLGGYAGTNPQLFLQTQLCYFRTVAVVFLLGFSFAGALLIPCLFALQGFFFSFSLFSFAFALGRDDFLILVFLFSLRFLLLPCTFFMAEAAMKKSLALTALALGRGKRTQPICYEPVYWLRFCTAGLILFFAAAAEAWLLPRILQLLLH